MCGEPSAHDHIALEQVSMAFDSLLIMCCPCRPHEMRLHCAVDLEKWVLRTGPPESRRADTPQCEVSEGEMYGLRASSDVRERSKSLINGWGSLLGSS